MPRVMVFLPEFKNPYQQVMGADATVAAARLGLDLDQVAFAGGGDVDPLTEQVRQVYTAVSAPDGERPDAILVMPVRESALQSLAEKALAAGVGIVFLNRTTTDIEGMRARFPELPIGFVTPDHVEAGRMQARQVAASLPSGGTVIYVQGRSSHTSAQGRIAGFQEGLASTRLQLATTLEAHWSGEMARSIVEKWLRMMVPSGLHIDAIACQSDVMALGAVQALHALAGDIGQPSLRAIQVFGIDGVAAEGRRCVEDGTLAGTVVMPSTTATALDLLAGWFQARRPFAPRVVMAPSSYPPESVLARRRAAAVA